MTAYKTPRGCLAAGGSQPRERCLICLTLSLAFANIVTNGILSVSVVFIIAVVIDQIRIKLLESSLFVWYDKHLDFKLNSLIKTDKYD